MSLIPRERITTMIPHAGSMCLLDAVLNWDAATVRCMSRRSRCTDSPMRRADGRLGAACGIEIAAQAMAVHGRLIAGNGGPPAHGYLAGVRDVDLRTAWLDVACTGDLIVDAERLMGDAHGAIYRFAVASGGLELLSGRATVLFGAAE